MFEMLFLGKLALSIATFAALTSAWVHPGILHTTADLNRMRSLVKSQIQPWYEAYEAFSADSHSSISYSFTEACPVVTRDKDASLIVCMDQFASDSTAALQLALMWYISEDEDYAAKATHILDAWGRTLKVVNGRYYNRQSRVDGLKVEKVTCSRYGRSTCRCPLWKPACQRSRNHPLHISIVLLLKRLDK
jgi:hypothetical protein